LDRLTVSKKEEVLIWQHARSSKDVSSAAIFMIVDAMTVYFITVDEMNVDGITLDVMIAN
jgi:hypothetical protein